LASNPHKPSVHLGRSINFIEYSRLTSGDKTLLIIDDVIDGRSPAATERMSWMLSVY